MSNYTKCGKPQKGPNFLGVRQANSGRWYAQIKVDGIAKHLGTFATKEEAALAYNDAAFQAWGRNARLNAVSWNDSMI